MIYIVTGNIYFNPHWCQDPKNTDVGTKNIFEKLRVRFSVEVFILAKFMNTRARPECEFDPGEPNQWGSTRI
jgi:hypothetical protein